MQNISCSLQIGLDKPNVEPCTPRLVAITRCHAVWCPIRFTSTTVTTNKSPHKPFLSAWTLQQARVLV